MGLALILELIYIFGFMMFLFLTPNIKDHKLEALILAFFALLMVLYNIHTLVNKQRIRAF